MIKLFSLLLTITILTSSSLFAKGWIVPPTSLPQKASAYIKSTYLYINIYIFYITKKP